MDNKENTNIPTTPVVPTAEAKTATLPGNAESTKLPSDTTALPGNEVTQKLPGDAAPSLPGDEPKAQELDLSNATAGAGAATKEAGLTGMVTFDYNNTPITDIVNSIILDAIDKGVSDIHMDPFEEGIKIRIRIDGKLHDYSIVPLYVKRNLVTRVKIISGMNITESRVPQDGAIRTTINDQPIDIRVSVLPTNLGEKVVMRIMDYTMSDQGIDHIDISDYNIEKIKRMMSLPNGIILVTGATGSGKSTTVYSILQALNTEETNIITVEDPVEMNIEGINQVMVNSDIGLTFATVLRSILRQDPDIIMIGEIRDEETARIAVRSAITGHLVLSTIHTNNALNTIERLTDMNVERYLLGSALSGIVSQKLARRLCNKCKRLRPTTEYEKEMFKKTIGKDVKEIYEPVGCKECSKGYRGRIAVHEVLLLNQAVRDAITGNVDKHELRKIVYGEGGTKTMLEDGLEKCLQGNTSFDEVLKLIDLDDDLGSDTQLGLQEQLEAAEINSIPEKKEEVKTPVTEVKKEEPKVPTPPVAAPPADTKPVEEKKEDVITKEANKLPDFLNNSPLMSTPSTPSTPVTPTKPVTPSTTASAPVTPITPVTPSTPATPVKPITPVTPSTSAKPVTPVTPVTPSAPATASAPTNSMASIFDKAAETIQNETKI